MLAVLAAITIVAAENFYGDVARQIGGSHVQVTSILRNPDVDPHLFEASPSVARAISKAQIVVYNGLAYDPWVSKLLSASPDSRRITIDVGRLVGKRPGDNPHVWYDPATMLAYSRALTADLSAVDPANRAAYEQGFTRFAASLQPIERRIANMRRQLGGTAVLATEPVFGYLLDDLGMRVLDPRFELEVMNNTEPGAREIADFENDLRTRRAALLIYNSQASDPVADRMRGLAQASHVPVVGVTETQPAGSSYQTWISSELYAVARALSK